MQPGRYYVSGYGPVDCVVEQQMGQPGLTYQVEGPSKGSTARRWSSLTQAEQKLIPIGQVCWGDVLEAMQETPDPLCKRGSRLRSMGDLLQGLPEEVGRFWAGLRQTSRTMSTIRLEHEARQILRRLFEAPECPVAVRTKGLALLAQAPRPAAKKPVAKKPVKAAA